MARRREIAILALGGAVLACAATPAQPPASRAEMFSWEGHQDEPSCGGTGHDEGPPRTPAQLRDDLAAAIEVAALRCDEPAAAAGRYGEVRVTLTPGADRTLSVGVKEGPGLVGEDLRCVGKQARAAVEGWLDPGPAGPAEWRTIYVALGKAPPLFASTAKLTSQWLAAKRSPAAGRRFAAQLPADVNLEDNGCLTMPARKAFNDRLDRWLASETPFHVFWQAAVTEVVAGLTTGGGGLDRRAYRFSDHEVLLRMRLGSEPPRQAICLLPFDDRLKQALQERIDQLGTCWAGDLDDILLHPRTEFPSGRRFTSVAAGPTRTCGLDDRGALFCCGERLSAAAPASTLSAVAVGTGFDCGVVEGGGVICWGADPPGGAVGGIPGPYREVVVSGREMCAIRRDTRALQCWDAGESRMIGTVREGVREASVSSYGVCALLEDGRIVCRGARRQGDLWREQSGPFGAFAASAGTVCGVGRVGKRDLQCWENRDGWPDVRTSDLPLFATTEEASEVALSGSEGCVLARSGRVVCWPAAGRNRLGGTYRTLVGGDGRICALTAGGQVECDRAWPYSAGQHP